jgi:hypothetical protein
MEGGALGWITGVGLTPIGRLEGRDTLDLMSEAAVAALADAERGREAAISAPRGRNNDGVARHR